MAGISFDITADSSGFMAKVSEIQKGVDNMAKVLGQLGKSLDTSTVEGKIYAMNKSIRANEEAMTAAKEKIRQYWEMAKQAFGENDMSSFERLNASVMEQMGALSKLTEETNKYRAAIETARQVAPFGEDTADAVDNVTRSVDELGERTASTATGMESLFSRVAKAASAIGVSLGAKELISRVIETRGEFQNIEVSLRTILGDADEANALMGRITETAAKTPFNLTDVAKSATQLLAYGESADTVTDTLTRLGDIAAGLSIPLNDIAYLYGTTMVQGRLYTQDLNQFLGRGIPLVSELAKQFNVTESAVKGLVEEGKVGFPEVRAAIESLTDEGGKFGGLMEEASKTVTGQMSNLQDAMDRMFNEIGESSEGAIYGAIETVSYAVEHYKELGNILMDVAVACGSYKAALVAVAAYQKVLATNAAAANILSAACASLTNAVKGLWTALEANPAALVGVAVAGLAVTVYELSTAETAAEKAARRHAEAMRDLEDKADGRKRSVSELIAAIQDETRTVTEHIMAYEELSGILPALTDKYGIMEVAVMDTAEAYKILNEELEKDREATLEKNVSDLEERLEDLNKAMGQYNGVGTGGFFTAGEIEETGERLRLAREELDKFREARAKAKELEDSGTGGQAEAVTEEEREAMEERLEARREANDKLLELQKENEEAEIGLMREGAEKRLRQIDAEYGERIREIEEKAAEMAEANRQAGVTGLDEAGLTSGQSTEVGRARENASLTRDRQVGDIYKDEIAAMRDYLKEYGSFQEKRKAIAEEYAEKIAAAETAGERLSLREQQRQALADFGQRQSEAGMGAVSGQLDLMGLTDNMYALTEAQSKAITEYLQGYLSSGRSSALTDADRQQLQYILDTLGDYVGGDLKSAFKAAGQAAEECQAAMARRDEAELVAEQAARDLASAQESLAKDMEDGSVTEASTERVEEAMEESGDAQQRLQMATGYAATALERMRSTAGNASDSLNSLIDGLKGLKSGSLTGIFGSVDKIASSFGVDLSGTLSGALSGLFGEDSALGILEDANVPVTNLVLSVLDILSDGLDNLVLDMVDTILGSIDGIASTITSVLNGDFFASLGNSLYEGVGGIFDTLTFGGISSWFSSSNAEWVEDVTDRLTDSNEALTTAVQELTEEIEDSAGIAAQEAAEEATEDQEQIIEQTMEILQTQMLYHSAHKSNAHYWDEYFTDEDYEELNEALAAYAEKYGTTASEAWSLSDIYELTPEEFNYIRTYYADVWDAMTSAGKYDKSEYWEAYADLAGSLEEISESLDESLTQTSFDSLYDSFIDTLMDMDAEAEDFADDFSEYMMQAMLSSSVSNMLGDELQDFYDTWSEYMNENEDASLTEAQLSELRDWWDEMVDEGLEIRDSLAAITGYDSSSTYTQEASTGAWESMSEDTAEELNGRFTALQMAGETVAAQMAVAQESMNTLVALTSAEVSAISSLSTLTLYGNGYLEDILKYTKLVYNDFSAKMDDMYTQLKRL